MLAVLLFITALTHTNAASQNTTITRYDRYGLIPNSASTAITAPLAHCTDNPHYFANNGFPVVLIGAGQPLPGSISTDFTPEVDAAAAANANYIRLWNLAVWDGSDEYYPWLRTGPGTAQDGGANFDLTQWDPNYWDKLKNCIAYAQSKNMYVSVLLFERCGMDAPDSNHRWDWCPWNPLNNVNDLNQLPTSGAGIPEFYDLSYTQLLSLQELYADKLIQETSSYPNVTYEICNEYTGDWAWEQHWVDFIKARCANIVSINHVGQTSNTPSDAWTDPSVDVVKLHWNTTSAGITNSNMVSTYNYGKPVDYDETPESSNRTLKEYQNMLWASFVGGGHCHLENGGNPDDAFTAVKYCRAFLDSNRVQYWQMSPNNALVTSTPGGSAYTLANPGSEYVTYISGSGRGSMKISLPDGYYIAWAYNPSTGTYTNLTVSGNTISGIPYYSSNIVIYVKNSGITISSPNISVSFATDRQIAASGDTITCTLSYKSTVRKATSTTIAFSIPWYASYVPGSATSRGTYDSAANRVKWSVSTLTAGAAGGSVTFQIKIN